MVIDTGVSQSKATGAQPGRRHLVRIDLGIASRHSMRVLAADGQLVCRAACVPTVKSLTLVEQAGLDGAREGTRLAVVCESTGPAWMPIAVFLASRGHNVYRVSVGEGRGLAQVPAPAREVQRDRRGDTGPDSAGLNRGACAARAARRGRGGAATRADIANLDAQFLQGPLRVIGGWSIAQVAATLKRKWPRLPLQGRHRHRPRREGTRWASHRRWSHREYSLVWGSVRPSQWSFDRPAR